MKITIKNSFDILKIINKLGLKDKIIEFTNTKNNIGEDVKVEYRKLRQAILDKYEDYDNYGDDKKNKINAEVLAENKDIQDNLNKLTKAQNEELMDLVFVFVERIPQAEKEVYQLIANIKNITVKEASEMEITDLIEIFKELIESDTINNIKILFTKATH